MEKLTNLLFNPKPSTLMLVDINSCFATIEQQANPKLRGCPVAVAAYDTPSGCILAASYEAKMLGVKTGMRVKEGKLLAPGLTVLTPDPQKYRDVHLKLRSVLSKFSDAVIPKSIDEFIVNLEGCPAFKNGMKNTGIEIKELIKKDVGDWITVSIGIGPNIFLAKTAAGLKKPDGLEEINISNFESVYSSLEITELHGIKQRNAARLASQNIYTVMDFYRTQSSVLERAFSSVTGYYWYLRLRGWEIDDVEWGRRSYGNSYAIPDRLLKNEDLAPILYKLVEKTSRRLRKAGYKAKGVHVAISYRDGSYWHHGHITEKTLFDPRDIFKEAHRLMCGSPYSGKTVAVIAESVFDIFNTNSTQLDLFENIERKEKLYDAVDKITDRWGEFVITPARMLSAKKHIHDRIAFGGIKELEEFTLQD
jgi:DNA polymerase-4